MGDASNVQTSFLGGEFSAYAQGRLDDPDYKKGMNVCRNTWPIETGAATRRVGTRFLDFTRNGQTGRMTAFSFSQSAPYTMEFTDGYLRFRDSHGLVKSDEPRQVTYISQDTPALLITSPACSGYTAWADGDEVMFNFPESGASIASGALVTRQFIIKAGSDQMHWSLYDALTGAALDGSTVQWDNTLAIQVAKIFEIATPYTNGAWGLLRGVQDDDSVLLLHPYLPPMTVFAPIDGGNLFTLQVAQFIDGPYLDPPIDGSYLTTSGVSGLINMTLTYPAWDNSVTYPNASRFAATTQGRSGSVGTSTQYAAGGIVTSGGAYYVSIADNNINHGPPNAAWWKVVPAGVLFGPQGLTSLDVGRSVRLLAQPPLWAAGTAYTKGQLSTYQGAYYVALQTSTGKIPGADADNWGVAANAAAWTWGIITDVSSPVSFTLSIQGAPLLYNANVTLFRFGLYANSTAWPCCGTFHEGRFWLGGALKNRFDASAAFGNTYEFTPTSPDGTVSDANGISYTFKSKQQNQIIWMEPDHQGIIMGTAQGEWLVQSSANNDPITPTSIQAHNVSKLGSANIEPVRAGISLAFVQRYGRKLIEYVCDLFSSKFSGLNLSERAKHLTGAGIVRVAHQQELVPILWAITTDGKLIGTTYKRESAMVSQPPNFNAWHRHDLGSGFNVIDMVEGPSPDGLLDTITLITQDPKTGYCRVEAITELYEETSTPDEAWFVDDGVIPCGAQYATVNGAAGITLSGLAQLNGFTVSAWIAARDCGDYLVTGGQIFVPFGSDPDKSFNLALLQALDKSGYEYQVQVQYTNPLNNTQSFMYFPPISNTYLSHFTYLNYGSQAITDWARDRVTFMLPGYGPYSGFVQYKISTGAFIQYVRIDGVYGGHIPAYYDNTVAYSASSRVLGTDNKLYTAKVSNSFGVNPVTSSTDWTNSADPQTLPAAYVGATTYAINNYVTTAGMIYKSLQNANTGHAPASSPTFWTPWLPVPAAWSPTTVYGTVTKVMGGNDHVFWPLQNVPAGQGDPNSFSINSNIYWVTDGSVWGPPITTSGLGLDYNGDIYMAPLTPPYTIVKIDGNTLKLKGNFTADAGDTLPAPNGLVPMRVLNNSGQSEGDYVLMTVNTDPAGTTHPSAVVLNVNSLIATETNTFVFDEGNNPIATSGSQGIGTGQAFVLTRSLAGAASTTPIGLYEISVFSQKPSTFKMKPTLGFWQDPNKNIYGNKPPLGSTFRKAGTLAPSAIDPTWTFFTGQSGMIYDAQDGNVMFFASTTNPSNYNAATVYAVGNTTNNYAIGTDNNVYKALAAGTLPAPVGNPGSWQLIGPQATQLSYMVKLTTDCARVAWRVPVAGAPTTDLSLQFVNISNGYYVFLESLGLGNWQVRRVNTLTGFATIQFPTQQGLAQLGGAQVYNDTTGDIVIYPQWDSTVGGVTAPPAPRTPVGGAPMTSFTGWGVWNVQVPAFDYRVPGVVGFTYTSQGQLLRPVAPQETGARNGPAFGKTRRNHRYAVAVANTQGIKFGTDFTEKMRPASFVSRGGKGALKLSAATLYTGEHSDTVEDDYDLDGMLCWQITRPYPATVTALGGFLQTQDR